MYFAHLYYSWRNILYPHKTNLSCFPNPECIFKELISKSNINNVFTALYSQKMQRLEDSERQITYSCSTVFHFSCKVSPVFKKYLHLIHVVVLKNMIITRVNEKHLTYYCFYKRCNIDMCHLSFTFLACSKTILQVSSQ